MAHFNVCSHLVKDSDKATEAYNKAITSGKDPFQVMMDMQGSLQKRLSNDKPYIANPYDLSTAGEVLDWLRLNKECIDDEYGELKVSLGEMSRGDADASAVWKPWKSRNQEARAKKVSEMSSEDQLEIKFEMIDIMHFILSMCIGLGLDAKEIFELYYLKNAENFARQDNGY